jgi:ABC-2 type transport system permease protein
MSGYIAFVKKEFTENMKNYRFLILFAVFLIFGIMSAFLAKFTPEILSALAADMEMTSEPVALDAWKQFYKNISGVGFSAFIILFGSCMSNEYSKGTLILMVTQRRLLQMPSCPACRGCVLISGHVSSRSAGRRRR